MKYLFALLLVFLLVLPARAQQLNPGGGLVSSGLPSNAVFPPGSVSITGNSQTGKDQITGVSVNGWQNVMAWGADPSGALDSTNAFNAAASQARIDFNSKEYYGTLFCPSIYWNGTAWMPAHYKLTNTVLIPGWVNVECSDAWLDFSTATPPVTGSGPLVGIQLGANPSDQGSYAWVFRPPHVSFGALTGPGQTTNSIGIFAGNCVPPTPSYCGYNYGSPRIGLSCNPGLYGQWMKGTLQDTQIAYWGTGLAIGGNVYDNKFLRNTFWQNGVGYDDRYMFVIFGTVPAGNPNAGAPWGSTNGGTDTVMSDNGFTLNNTAAYICSENEIDMENNAFEDNKQPYIKLDTCNCAGNNTVKIKSRFEWNNQVPPPVGVGQAEFVDIVGGQGLVDLSGSDFVDVGGPAAGFPVCYDTNADSSSNGHIKLDNIYVGFMASNTTRPVYGNCVGNTDQTKAPTVSWWNVRPFGAAIPDITKVRLSNPNIVTSAVVSGAAPNFAVGGWVGNDRLWGVITRLTCINQTGGTCTTAPTFNVFAASATGTALACSNAVQTVGSFNTTVENLGFSPGINFGAAETVAGTGCTAPNFLVSVTAIQTQ